MVAIIPARGGSKGLPGKNIKLLSGKPMIGYTIEAAMKSNHISDIIVSTDDPEIAEVAKSFGAKVPFMRPGKLAGDKSSAIDTYIYTIDKLNSDFGYSISDFTVLQPTSPLRTSDDIDAAATLFKEKNADSVISVTEALHPPIWAKKIRDDGVLVNYFESDLYNKNRQEIETAYMPNGAIFIFKFEKLKSNYTYYFERTFPHMMEAERSIDIDTHYDFDIAGFLLNRM